MIVLHRLTDPDAPLYLNSDLIQIVESLPDTHVALTNGSTLIVRESPAEVAEAVRRWRASLLALAFTEAPGRTGEDPHAGADYQDA